MRCPTRSNTSSDLSPGTCWTRGLACQSRTMCHFVRPDVGPRVLPVMVLFERGEHGWRFRLAGTEIDRRWGRTVTGLDYTQLVSGEAFHSARREFECIAQTPCGTFTAARVTFNLGRRAALEILRLPLRASDGRVSLILCSAAEVSQRKAAHGADLAQEIGGFEQQFFDIDAGLPWRVAVIASLGVAASDETSMAHDRRRIGGARRSKRGYDYRVPNATAVCRSNIVSRMSSRPVNA
jgi:hypothetical protein